MDQCAHLFSITTLPPRLSVETKFGWGTPKLKIRDLIKSVPLHTSRPWSYFYYGLPTVIIQTRNIIVVSE